MLVGAVLGFWLAGVAVSASRDAAEDIDGSGR